MWTFLDIATLFEQHLQRENPRLGQIQYRLVDVLLGARVWADIYVRRAEDLFRFIDTYKEFVALVFEPSQRVRWQNEMNLVGLDSPYHVELPSARQGVDQGSFNRSL